MDNFEFSCQKCNLTISLICVHKEKNISLDVQTFQKNLLWSGAKKEEIIKLLFSRKFRHLKIQKSNFTRIHFGANKHETTLSILKPLCHLWKILVLQITRIPRRHIKPVKNKLKKASAFFFAGPLV